MSCHSVSPRWLTPSGEAGRAHVVAVRRDEHRHVCGVERRKVPQRFLGVAVVPVHEDQPGGPGGGHVPGREVPELVVVADVLEVQPERGPGVALVDVRVDAYGGVRGERAPAGGEGPDDEPAAAAHDRPDLAVAAVPGELEASRPVRLAGGRKADPVGGDERGSLVVGDAVPDLDHVVRVGPGDLDGERHRREQQHDDPDRETLQPAPERQRRQPTTAVPLVRHRPHGNRGQGRERSGPGPSRSSAARIWPSHSVPSSAPVRELVASIPAPRGDHRQHEDPALAQQVLIDARIVLADFFGRMGEVEFDRPTATRLEVDEQRPVLRGEHVARVRLAVQQLLGAAALADRPSQASVTCCRAAPGPRRRAPASGRGSPRVVEPRSTRSVKCGAGTSSLAHAGMQPLERMGVLGR